MTDKAKKKARGKKSKIPPLEHWISWSPVEQLILSVHIAKRLHRKNHKAALKRFTEPLFIIQKKINALIMEPIEKHEEASDVRQYLNRYKAFTLEVLNGNVPTSKQMALLSKLLPDKFILNPVLKSTKGRFEITNLHALLITKSDFENLKSSKTKKYSAVDEILYRKMVAATGGELPGFRTNNENASKFIQVPNELVDWDQAIFEYLTESDFVTIKMLKEVLKKKT